MSSPSLGKSQDAPFTPRKEFVKELATQTKSFSLLALSSSNCIRLYSFSPLAVASLRHLLEQSAHIISSREDAAHNLYEFALDGKPWANPKSVPTEKLLVDIIAVIYQSGYTYLSTIDYGREADDRLAMTFSTLFNNPPASRTATPSPPANSANHDSIAGSSMAWNDKPLAKRVPFAISFSSVTVMRVISPPLHLTPAILQAVRGSWPRGVVAEKKVGDNSYEFKLKGYKWFQEDTFATDSLVHILSLLTSLDSHSFTLLTSISLTNRSRVKDLWIFTGPAPEGGSLNEASKHSFDGNPIKPPMIPLPPLVEGHISPDHPNQHRRAATDPMLVTPYAHSSQHQRAATESFQQPRYDSQRQVLRKPAPRAQVPISVGQDLDIPDEPIESPPLRAHMPSTISSGIEDMTGVGASPNIFYATSPLDGAPHQMQTPFPTVGTPFVESPIGPSSPPLSISDGGKTLPLSSPSSLPPSPHKASSSPANTYFDMPSHASSDVAPALPPLLGVGTFRDSAFSVNSEASCEIPIKWTGPLTEEMKAEQRMKPSRSPSSGPVFPGGWQPTPIAEKSEDETIEPSEQNKTPIHEMLSRIESPEIVRPDMSLRKSEAALVGIIHSTSPAPPVPQPDRSQQPPSAGGGQGWVLVDVDNPNTPNASNQPKEPLAASTEPVKHTDSRSHTSTPIEQPSPAAKAIVIMDAMDTKHKKSQSTSNPKLRDGGSGGVRRFFSLSKKTSRKALNNDEEKTAPTSIPRSNLRDRLRLIGTPEASRREDKRRSID